jgi:spore coat protein B
MEKASLDLLIGRSVRVDRGGPESRMGKLLAVKNDHVVVYIENEGMLYYKIDHIKSLSLDTRDVSDLVPVTVTNELNPVVLPSYIEAEDFATIMKTMQNRWVQINRGGPEKIEGVLVEATDELGTIIAGNEIIQVLYFHIRNISYGLKNNNQQSNDNNNNNNNNEKQSSNKNKQSKDKK